MLRGCVLFMRTVARGRRSVPEEVNRIDGCSLPFFFLFQVVAITFFFGHGKNKNLNKGRKESTRGFDYLRQS